MRPRHSSKPNTQHTSAHVAPTRGAYWATRASCASQGKNAVSMLAASGPASHPEPVDSPTPVDVPDGDMPVDEDDVPGSTSAAPVVVPEPDSSASAGSPVEASSPGGSGRVSQGSGLGPDPDVLEPARPAWWSGCGPTPTAHDARGSANPITARETPTAGGGGESGSSRIPIADRSPRARRSRIADADRNARAPGGTSRIAWRLVVLSSLRASWVRSLPRASSSTTTTSRAPNPATSARTGGRPARP